GYTVASYNRLAALLTGVMSYQYGGREGYLFPYLLDAKKINSVTGLSPVFMWPSSSELWLSESTSTLLAGLNGRYIWSGTFGYLYSDLGWFTMAYLFAVG